MRTLLILPALLCAIAATGAENLLTTPLTQWKRDFRPDNRPDIYAVTATGDTTVISRNPASKFGRIYVDTKLTPGNTYRLSCERMTERGALVKMLVIFKGADGQWREKTRLSNYEPLVNREWSESVMTFEVPADAVETRLDFRLDSFGTVQLRQMKLEQLTADEADAWRKATTVKPFQPGSTGDYALTPGAYYQIEFTATPTTAEDGRLELKFHSPEQEWFRDGSLTFFVRDGKTAKFREVIVVPDNADGARIEPQSLKIEQLTLTKR